MSNFSTLSYELSSSTVRVAPYVATPGSVDDDEEAISILIAPTANSLGASAVTVLVQTVCSYGHTKEDTARAATVSI